MGGGGIWSRSPIDTVALARVNIRDLARKAEEAAVMLEGAGYGVIPGELMQVSERLTKIREALEAMSGHGKEGQVPPT
jgi:hypothetical protein